MDEFDQMLSIHSREMLAHAEDVVVTGVRGERLPSPTGIAKGRRITKIMDKATELPDSVLAKNLRATAPYGATRNVKRMRISRLEDGFAHANAETADFLVRLIDTPPCSEFYEWENGDGRLDSGISSFWRRTCRQANSILGKGVVEEEIAERGPLYAWGQEPEGKMEEMGGWDVLEQVREEEVGISGPGIEGIEVERGKGTEEEIEGGTDLSLDLSGIDASLGLDTSQESQGIGVGKISVVSASQIPDFEDVPLSQIELPVVPLSPRARKAGPEREISVSGVPSVLSKITAMFVEMLHTAFEHYSADEAHVREGSVWVTLDEVLALAAGDLSRVSDHDAAVSFVQVLTLATMQAVTVVQQRSYRSVYVTRGVKWSSVVERQRRQGAGKKRAREIPEEIPAGVGLSQGESDVSLSSSLNVSQAYSTISQY